MQNNFPKISLLVSAIFLCILSGVFFYFYTKVNNNNQESRASDLLWQTEALRRNEIKELNNSIKVVEGERAELGTHFAQSSDAVPFLDTIEQLAPPVGAEAEVTSVDIMPDHTALVVGMHANGSFDSVYKFLTLLENSPYELEFVSVNFEREGAALGGAKVSGVSNWNVILKIKLLSFIQ